MKPRILDSLPNFGEQPLLIYEDEHVLVLNKPVGWLTHADGKDQRPSLTAWRPQHLGIHSRLDVDTTGIIIFSKSEVGQTRLREAFEERKVEKTYLAVTSRTPSPRQGDWIDRMPDGKRASLSYKTLRTSGRGALVEVKLHTGRRHQIRFQLAKHGCPIIGDARYGDPIDRRAPRTLLHAQKVTLPNGKTFEASLPVDMIRYAQDDPIASRVGLKNSKHTDVYRLFNGAADGHPGWFVDRYGDIGWVRQDAGKMPGPMPNLPGFYGLMAPKDRSKHENPGAQHLRGISAQTPHWVKENDVEYAVYFEGERSTGMFLDQRPQRAWLRENGTGLEILNTFAHAGAFSVAASVCGAASLNLDLSKRWLARMPEQLERNGADAKDHRVISGDVFEWLPRLARQGRQFDLVILDPPSTSIGKRKKRWSASSQYASLVAMAAPLIKPGGILWASTNHRQTTPHHFLNKVASGLSKAFELERICPPAVDHPCNESAHLKVHVWRNRA